VLGFFPYRGIAFDLNFDTAVGITIGIMDTIILRNLFETIGRAS